MALDSRYIPFYNIAQFIWDKESALPLTAGKVRFWVDTQRATPKEVFRLSGISPDYTYTSLDAELTLGPTGAFVDDSNMPIVIYAFPYDVDGNIQRYYIEVFSEDDVPQFVVEAAPYVFTTELPPDSVLSGDNELNNSQFVEVSFNSTAPHTYTFTGAVNEEVQVAPNWILEVSGSGTVTVERIVLTEVNTPTNPPYVLDIDSAGISILTLTQRLTNSPRLIAGGYVSGYFIAASQDSLQHALQMEYNPSGGTLDDNVIIDATITGDGSYNVLQGNLQITGTINPDPATTGYVDIDIIMPVGAHIRLSSFQLVQVNTAIDIAYGQLSTPKQINTLYQVYKPSYQQSKNSLTPWWYFPHNPVQFGGSDASVASRCSYIFDQTILYQTAANQVGFAIGPSEYNGVLAVTAVANATDARFALITYIAPQSVQGSWGYFLSSMVSAYINTSHASQLTIKMRILYRDGYPPTISNTEPIASWTLGQDPSFAAGWTDITPLNDPAYTLTAGTELPSGDAAYPLYPFDQFQLPEIGASSENMIAVIFYVMEPLNSTAATEDVIAIRSISTVQNQFAQDWVPVGEDEVRSACSYYFYSSYPTGISIGTATLSNQLVYGSYTINQPGTPVGDTTVTAEGQSFTIVYPKQNRDPVDLQVYSPTTGGNGDMDVFFYSLDGTPSTALSTVPFTFTSANAGSQTYATYYPIEHVGVHVFAGHTSTYASSYWAFHFFVDSRLGV